MSHLRYAVILCLHLLAVSSIPPDVQAIMSPCDGHACAVGHQCTLLKENPICICNHYCAKSSTTGELCSWNQRTYQNLCELRSEECRTGKYITVQHYGACSNSKGEANRVRHTNRHAVRCADSRREARLGLCKAWKRHGACIYQKTLMNTYCKRTCGYCKGKRKIDGAKITGCKGTRYGCCKGSKLVALGPNNEGCLGKGCKDMYMCKYFPQFCGNSSNALTMRKYCPLTCRYCVVEEMKTKKKLNPPKLK